MKYWPQVPKARLNICRVRSLNLALTGVSGLEFNKFWLYVPKARLNFYGPETYCSQWGTYYDQFLKTTGL